ncbi:hypothetical protein AGMMS49938_02790 [Fibrobacterales bacterium]|nr:hypothetical protein AGMMS49938_02790 [Fibrobacterales bacterium]
MNQIVLWTGLEAGMMLKFTQKSHTEAQIERAAERNDLDIADFKEVLDGVREMYAENSITEMEEEVDGTPFVNPFLLSEISPQAKLYEEAVSKLRTKAAKLLEGIVYFKERKAILVRNFPHLSNSDLNKLANENLFKINRQE